MDAKLRCWGCHARLVDNRGDETVGCAECGLRMAGLSAMPMDYGAAYSEDTTLYGEHLRALDRFQTAPYLRPLLLPFEALILRRLKNDASVRSLVDLGCGTGRFLRAAEVAGLTAGGFEVADVLVQRLRGHGRKVQQGGVAEFLAGGERPDALTLLEVIEHLREPGEAIDALLELRPRHLFVVVPDWSVRRRFDVRFDEHDRPPNHLTWWNHPSLTRLLTRHGYAVTVEPVAERRKSMLGHILRNRNAMPQAGVLEWAAALSRPPSFWLLGTASRPS